MSETTTGDHGPDDRRSLPGTVLYELRRELQRQIDERIPAYAALGATDAIAHRLLGATVQGVALASRIRSDDVGPSQLPRFVIAQALSAAGRLESAYSGMADRGRGVAERVRDGRQAAELVRLVFLTVNKVRSGTEPASSAVVVGETVPAPSAAPAHDGAGDPGPAGSGDSDPWTRAAVDTAAEAEAAAEAVADAAEAVADAAAAVAAQADALAEEAIDAAADGGDVPTTEPRTRPPGTD